MHLPSLISDLALMLITAGVVTLIFKKLRQPLVLGYIVAGFLIGPYFHWLPQVTDTASISTWSEIGIIILMFYLGLEFNLHKLASVGGTAIITAVVEVAGMLLIGFLAGKALGWSTMNSVFLGGMLSMSSTTIIIKAFEELKLRGKKFTELVFGTLIIEDIAGIFMMIILSTISVSQNITGGELAVKILLLLFYLALWMILGIFLIPTFLKHTANLMNNETLLIVSLGMCFGMVLLANYLGFSSALGAFLAGSLLAGTIHAGRVEHSTKSVRDLFGAVFFISVGMLVDPAVLAEYIWPIVIITVATIIGKLIFSTLGMLLSGQTLSNAMHGGFSLAQIGEFAFIIASLGQSLGVTGNFLYPIVVSVSVITTFTTPFFIKGAAGATRWLEKRLPPKLLRYLNRYTDENQSEKEHDSDWQAYIKHYFFTLLLYGVIILGIALFSTQILLPLLAELIPRVTAQIVVLIICYGGMALFVRPILDRRNPYYTSLWLKSRSFRLPLIALFILRLAVILTLALLPLQQTLGINALWALPVLLLLLIVFARSDRLAGSYLQFEACFLANFNECRLCREEDDPSHAWLDEQLYIISFRLQPDSPFIGSSLIELNWGRMFDSYVVKIVRGRTHINVPPGQELLRADDVLYVLGEAKQIENMCRALDLPISREEQTALTLRRFISSQEADCGDQLFCYAIRVEKDSPLYNVSIKDSPIRSDLDLFLLGLERNHFPIIKPDLNMLMKADDLIWVLGTQKMAGQLARQDLLS